MASYGYSTPYHGLAGGALPAGYMEAATAPGRLLGQGIASLGRVMTIGTAACAIASLVLLPAILALLCRHGYFPTEELNKSP